MSTLGTSFGSAASAYEQGRPTYPADAVAWMLGESPLDVLDVGAGSGKLTRVVVPLGHRVSAVDPDSQMLETLSAHLPDVPTAVGTAEDLPVPTASADAVVLGQAWHWVNTERASAEIGRVLRPGGTLGLIWNIRDESVPWVSALSNAMGASKAESMMSRDEVVVTAPFGALEHRRWEWQNSVTREDLIAMARSRSLYIAADAAERERIDTAVDRVLAGLDSDAIDLPYVTHAFRAMRD